MTTPAVSGSVQVQGDVVTPDMRPVTDINFRTVDQFEHTVFDLAKQLGKDPDEVRKMLLQQPGVQQVLDILARAPAPPVDKHWEAVYDDVFGVYKLVAVQDSPGEQDGKTPVDDGGFLGWILRRMGYNYLGPGTDYMQNIQKGVQPVNDLDRAAMLHDHAYTQIAKMYSEYKISDSQAAQAIRDADMALAERASQAKGLMSVLTATGMTAKAFVDWMVGQGSWLTLTRSGPNDPVYDKPSDAAPISGDPDPGDHSKATGISGNGGNDPMQPVNVSKKKHNQFSGFIDRNNNGIDDRLERKRPKWHRRYLRRFRQSSLWRL